MQALPLFTRCGGVLFHVDDATRSSPPENFSPATIEENRRSAKPFAPRFFLSTTEADAASPSARWCRAKDHAMDALAQR